jgi:two-component system cell cycle response regulator DivK
MKLAARQTDLFKESGPHHIREADEGKPVAHPAHACDSGPSPTPPGSPLSLPGKDCTFVEDESKPTMERKPARILIAEDHTDSRDALQALVEAHGYSVFVAMDGRQAIDRAESAQPDLILMDVMMPIVDGLAATRHLRAKRAFDRVPILALTAMEGARERAAEAGCDDYITKPIDLPAFFQKVRWWLEHGRRVGEPGGARAGGAA